MGRRRTRLLAVVVTATVVLVATACQPPKKSAPPFSTDPPELGIDPNFVTGLSNPWDIAFVPGDAATMFFTQRHGPISVKRGGNAPVQLTPAPPGSEPAGEGGVMGIAVDPNFGSGDRFIYVCYTHDVDNRVVRYTVNGTLSAVGPATDLVTGIPKAGNHNGCRIRFGFDGMLWITTGDAQNPSTAQNAGTLNGKVLRVKPADGGAAPGNPGGSRVITRGHRNPQGIAFRANGLVYTTEHGPDRDDEVNLLSPDPNNYGWNGATMTVPGATPALWSSGVPTIAPSGATFVYGSQWKGWHGALVIAVLKAQRLQVFLERNGNLEFAGPVVVPMGVRLRSAVQGPDGNLYLATDVGGGAGAIWKVVPG